MPFPSTRAGIEAQRGYRDECAEDNLPCWLCGQPIDYVASPASGDPNAFNADHAIPTSVDPDLALDPENFRPSHAGCNKSRGNKVPEFALGALSEEW